MQIIFMTQGLGLKIFFLNLEISKMLVQNACTEVQIFHGGSDSPRRFRF